MNNKLYLVAIPVGNLYSKAYQWQQELNNKYNMYSEGNLPPLHITLEVFAYDSLGDLNKITEVINKVVASNYGLYFRAAGFSFFSEPFKAINIHIVKTPQLRELAKRLRTRAHQSGIAVRDIDEDEIVYHLNLVGAMHGRDWNMEEALEAWDYVRKRRIEASFYAKRLELWYPDCDPKKHKAGVFSLHP